jgi:predicted permease
MAFGLLKPGVSGAEAQADLAAIAAHLSATYPDTNARRGVRFYPMPEGHPELREVAPAVWLAMSAVGLVLLIACFNVTALLLARAAERRREIAVRAALGATRWRIVRQLVTEGLVLSSISGAAALVLANWSSRLLSAFSLPSPIPQRLHLSIDARLVAFTVLLAGIAGVLPALVPALKATAGSVMASMRLESTSGTGASSHTRKAFVMAQIAGSTVFLGTAMIFLRAFLAASSFSPGVDMTHPLIVEMQPSLYGYDAERSRVLADRIVSRLSALPGVSAVSIADRVPFFVGYPKTQEASLPSADCTAAPCPKVTAYAVAPGHFAALGIPLRAGRDFTPDEIRSHRAVIVDETMAQQYWPSGSALGQALRVGRAGIVEVVGVAASVSYRGPQAAPQPVLYRPFGGAEFADPFSIIVRATGDPLALAAPVREALHALAPSVPLQQVHTMRDRYDMPLWAARTATGLFGICGVLALLLATAGLFGVTYLTANQRTREFGVRIALGARAADIMRLVLGEGLAMCVPATAVGLVLAAATGRLLARSIVGVRLSDPSTYAIVAIVEVAVALLACALPARRAARSAPMAALRAE